MSVYNCYVQTAHMNCRCYQVVAASLEAAKRAAGEYGRVTYVMRVCACTNRSH